MKKEAFKNDVEEIGQVLLVDCKRKIGENAPKRTSFQRKMQYRRQNKSTNTYVGEDVLPRLVETKNVVINIVASNFTKYFITKLITIILRVTHYNVTEH